MDNQDNDRKIDQCCTPMQVSQCLLKWGKHNRGTIPVPYMTLRALAFQLGQAMFLPNVLVARTWQDRHTASGSVRDMQKC